MKTYWVEVRKNPGISEVEYGYWDYYPGAEISQHVLALFEVKANTGNEAIALTLLGKARKLLIETENSAPHPGEV